MKSLYLKIWVTFIVVALLSLIAGTMTLRFTIRGLLDDHGRAQTLSTSVEREHPRPHLSGWGLLPPSDREIVDGSGQIVSSMRAAEAQVFWAGFTALLVVFIVAGFLGFIVLHIIGCRLQEIRRCMALVAQGDLTQRLLDPADDEIGELGHSFNRMAGRLEGVVRELGSVATHRRQFLADVSHELRTPLTSLGVNLEQLMDRMKNSGDGSEIDRRAGTSTPRIVSMAFEEVQRLSLLVEDLLELARMDSTDFKLKRGEEVLQRVVQRSVDRFSVAFANRELTCRTHLDPEPMFLRIDARRMEQVLANLIMNAVHHLQAGGHIDVFARREGGVALLEVADDGPGIPPDALDHVFDRYYARSSARSSTGLGLAIVKRLVEAHGGTVRLANREPKGTRAVVELSIGSVALAEKKPGTTA